MQNTIMTEKLARRGARIPTEYAADFLDTVLVRDAMKRDVVTLAAGELVGTARAWLASKDPRAAHQGFPVVDGGTLVGVVTRRDLLDGAVDAAALVRDLVKRAAIVLRETSSLREAADQMVDAEVGRLPVLGGADGLTLVGILTRSDVLGAHRERLDAGVRQSSRFAMPGLARPKRA